MTSLQGNNGAVFGSGDAAVAAGQDGRVNDAEQNYIAAALEK